MSIQNLNVLSFLKHNFFDKAIKRNRGKYLLTFGKTVISSKGNIELEGSLLVNSNKKTGNKTGRSSIIQIESCAKLCVKNRFNMFYGSDVVVFQGGELVLNGGFFNSNVTVRCYNRITIGEGAAISHGVLIQDYDGHELFRYDEKGKAEKLSNTEPITIGKHVLIFANATILKGVNIGEGAVVAAGAVVTNDVPANTLVAGVPAHVVKRNMDWN